MSLKTEPPMRIKCPEIPIEITQGEEGLYYATSSAIRGLLVAGKSIDEVKEKIPQALAEMLVVKREIESS
jgi:predicted RNase H-like HicB family nuclease